MANLHTRSGGLSLIYGSSKQPHPEARPTSIYIAGLLIAVAPRYRYCSGASFTVAVAPILLAESSGDGSAATF